jgi:hypothetical protein
VRQDASDDAGIFDRGDQAHPVAAVGAREDVHPKDPLEQLGPAPARRRRSARGRGSRLRGQLQEKHAGGAAASTPCFPSASRSPFLPSSVHRSHCGSVSPGSERRARPEVRSSAAPASGVIVRRVPVRRVVAVLRRRDARQRRDECALPLACPTPRTQLRLVRRASSGKNVPSRDLFQGGHRHARELSRRLYRA